jgi:hypothetical protein
MANIEKIIQSNSIVKRLIVEGDLSPENLKRVYRRLCKITHPDLQKQDSIEFIQLKDEYEEAKEIFEDLKAYLIQKGNTSLLEEDDVRRMFYAGLRHYMAAGLYSLRMRIRPEMKKRNELILREVLYWAKLYKPTFIKVFLEYNKAYLKRYVDWQRRDNLAKAQKVFLFGFRDILSYEENRSPRALKASRSYFLDCVSILESTPPTPAGLAVHQFAMWFLDELDSLVLAVPKNLNRE